MENNYLDNFIKNALEGLEGDAYDAKSWSILQEKMKMDAELSSADNSDFDHKVKEALEQIEPAYTPAAWALMETRLGIEDGLVEADAPAEFDANVKEMLDGVEVDYTPEAWELMEAHLDLEDNLAELEDTDVVDAVAYNNLHNLEVPYDAESWHPLSEKIKEEFSFRRRVLYRYKVAEIALMLLFLFTMYNYLPVHNQMVSKVNEIKEEVASKFSGKTSNELVAANTLNEKRDNTSPVKATAKQAAKNASINQQNNSIEIEETLVESTNSFNLEPTVSHSTTNIDVYNNPQESAITTLFEITPNSEEKINSLSNKIELSLEETSTKTERFIDDMSMIPSLKSRFIEEKAQDVIDCILCKPLLIPLKISAAMFLVGDYNYIMTPYDRDFDLTAYNHASSGYGVGFTFGFGFGNWEVETGGIYAAKRYEPKAASELLGDFQSGYITNRLKEIQLNIIQVPLNVKYSFDKLPNWNIYALAGASLNVAANANYYFETQYATRPQQGFTSGSQEIIEEESTYNNKIFSNGWFEGGSFLENRYFTANLGLGMERRVSSKWSVFMQNSYQHTLSTSGIGLGPNKDRLNNISIFAGARATLK